MSRLFFLSQRTNLYFNREILKDMNDFLQKKVITHNSNSSTSENYKEPNTLKEQLSCLRHNANCLQNNFSSLHEKMYFGNQYYEALQSFLAN